MQQAILDARASAAQEEQRRYERCSFCGGVGYVHVDVPFGDPRFGKPMPCRKCTKIAEIAQYRVEKLSVIPAGLAAMKATWATFPPHTDQEALRKVRNYVKAIIAGSLEQRGVVLRGKNQIGKTGMAYCVHNDLLAAQIPSVFIRAIDFLDRMQVALMDNENRERHITLMENFTTITHLVIDDLGAEKLTDKRQEFFYNLFDVRSNSPTTFTTITSNLEGEDLREKLGDRVYSRFANEKFFQVLVRGEMNALNGVR